MKMKFIYSVFGAALILTVAICLLGGCDQKKQVTEHLKVTIFSDPMPEAVEVCINSHNCETFYSIADIPTIHARQNEHSLLYYDPCPKGWKLDEIVATGMTLCKPISEANKK